MTPSLGTVLLGLLLAAPPAPLQRQEPPRAPDGRRGLGSASELAELLRLFRQPTDEDRAFLEELLALENEVSVLVATLEARYRERGYLALLPRREASLETLHAAALDAFRRPVEVLEDAGREAPTWAELLLDARFWMRAEVLEGWERDARNVRSGLLVLRGVTDGWVRFDEETGQTIAARVDLAAALLRARISDLSALREAPEAPSEVPREEVARLVDVVSQADEEQRGKLVGVELQGLERKLEAMRSLLFTDRLRRSAAGEIQRRADADRRAEAARQAVRVWQPQTDEGKKAPSEIRRVKKTERRREAYRRAVEGLRYDPLDAELAYAAGLMAQFVAGTYESLSYFDRFLALRGIRVHDDRNWRKRKLTDEEKNAIFEIQRFEREELPGTGGGGENP